MTGFRDTIPYDPKGFRSINAIRSLNAANGHFWFAPATMECFNTRIESGVICSWYFVTSEDPTPGGEGRRYTVRRADKFGRITTVGTFGQYATVHAAIDSIRENLR